jgi:hypothetical protein
VPFSCYTASGCCQMPSSQPSMERLPRRNEQVKRNAARFPADFIFRLTPTETAALNRSQNATGSQKHREYSAYVAETSYLRSQFATLNAGRDDFQLHSHPAETSGHVSLVDPEPPSASVCYRESK